MQERKPPYVSGPWICYAVTGGDPIYYRLTTDKPSPKCEHCARGNCVQRVETCDEWTSVEHGYQDLLS